LAARELATHALAAIQAGMLLARDSPANRGLFLMASLRSVEGESAALARAAHAAGTRVAFGIPGGGANLTLIQACADVGIAFVLVRSESAAVLAAAAYADVADAPGLAVCTRGPGLAAATLGSASALLDRQPVVVATDGTGAAHPHQRIDHARLGATVSKGVVIKGSAAVELALGEPRGSVIFDLGGDRASPAMAGPDANDPPATTIRVPGNRPVIIAGVGARGCADALRRVVRGRRIPVLTTYRAKGVVPDSWPNAAGFFSGFPREGLPLAEADAIVAVGLDPVELLPTPWCWDARVVSLCDAQPHARAQVPEGRTAIGPLDQLLDRLVLEDGGWPSPTVPWRAAMLEAIDVPVGGLSPQAVVRAARSALPLAAIAAIDAGAHMFVAMAFWEVEEPYQCLISSGLATMAFALPAAIGASYAREVPVVCFIGDGGLGMCAAELETLARTRRDVRVVVFNDACLSLIRIKQTGLPTDRAAVSHAPVDYAACARAFGIPGVVVQDTRELRAAFEQPAPCLIDARIDASGYGAILESIRGPVGAGRRE
jgi:acetolactate synthase I/II/III large subunit